MRDDCLLVLIAGAGGFKGSGFFGPSPLNKYHDQFVVSYPYVPYILLDWNETRPIGPLIAGKSILGIGHSFGGQRLLHQCFAAESAGALSIHTILIDPVRYTKSDTVDPVDRVDSDAVIQKIDREPLPVPSNIQFCTCFLRKGGQDSLSFPESSPILASGGQYANVLVDVPGIIDLAKHADICKTKEVFETFWKSAAKVFGRPAIAPSVRELVAISPAENKKFIPTRRLKKH